MQLRVLVLIDDAKLRSRVERILEEVDVFVRAPRRTKLSWDTAEQVLSDLLIVSHDMIPEPADDCVRRFADAKNAPEIIVLSGNSDAEEITILRAAGVEACLNAEAPDDVLEDVMCKLVEKRRDILKKTVAARRSTPRPQLTDFVSASPTMCRFLEMVRDVVDSEAPLLITGETGVGKERLARAIHNDSLRADGPFMSVNCGAIPENLLESQLFGHEKGAFTGATRTQRGCFELAHGGTLFLDEIGEMELHLQVKLLHVLQDYEIAPVGGEKKIPVDVRVIAATNRNIQDEIEQKRVREDLYYRLAVIALTVPPLRDRKEDIPTLASSFYDALSARTARQGKGIAPEAMEALCAYSWPGNVRELINVVERGILLCRDGQITFNDLPADIAARGKPVDEGALPSSIELVPDEWVSRPLKEFREDVIERVEKAYLAKLLTLTEGRVGETAERAGIEPRSLFNKMKRYGLSKEDFRRERNQ